MKASLAENDATFIDTPRGIFTAGGRWFHTTEKALKEYAGPLLDRESIPRLIDSAEVWLKSPDTVILWATPFLLAYLGSALTGLVDIFLFFLFALWGPVLASHRVLPILRILDNVLSQAVLYILSMSIFAIRDQFSLMTFGLVLFVLVRWGLIDKLFALILQPLRKRLYKVPYADQMLKSVIIRAALRHRIALPELDRMEHFIVNQLHRK